MSKIFTDSFQDEVTLYQEISDVVDNVLGQKAQEYQKQQLFDYLLSLTTKSSNNYSYKDSYDSSYHNYNFPSYNQIPSINLYIPSSQYNPYFIPQNNFCQHSMIPTNQFSYMIPPNQIPLIYQPQLLQQPPNPYFNQQYLLITQSQNKKSKSKKKSHKKKEKKSTKDHKHKSSKLKETDKKKLIFSKPFSGNSFNGICSELNKRCNSNCNEEGIIQISGNIYEDVSIVASFSSLVDYEDNSDPAYDSEDSPDSYLLFDFKEHRVSINAYSIKATNNSSPSYFTSWILEGSNDKIEWTRIDTHLDDQRLVGRNKIETFNIQDQKVSKKKFKFIKIQMVGEATSDDYFFELKKIEFFGNYYEK